MAHPLDPASPQAPAPEGTGSKAGDPTTRDSGASSAAADLVATVERLWPDRTPRPVRRRSVIGDAESFFVVPSLAEPRILLPTRRSAAARAMGRYSAALTTREVLQRRVVSLGLRVGAGALLPDRIRLSPDGGSEGIDAHLADVLGEPVTVSLGIGNLRANRKPVLQVFDRKGRALAFVKIGDTPVAADHVRGEAEVLRRLGDATWDLVAMPQLVAAGSWRGMPVLVMSALQTPPQWRQPSDGMLRRAEDEVHRSTPGPELPLGQTTLWSRVRDASAVVTDPTVAARLAAAVGRAEELFAEWPVSTGGWHGDWTPWNVARAGTRLLVWDWERYEAGVPRGIDRVHYEVNSRLRAPHPTAVEVLACLDEAIGPVTQRGVEAVRACAYLAAVSTRYLVAAEKPGGRAIRERSLLMLGAFAALVGAEVDA